MDNFSTFSSTRRHIYLTPILSEIFLIPKSSKEVGDTICDLEGLQRGVGVFTGTSGGVPVL